MEKKFLRLRMIIINIVIFMCFGVFNGCNTNSKKGYKILEEYECHYPFVMSEYYCENYANSKIAFETVMESFFDDEGNYTNDFGGSYIDGNGIFNICVVGSRRPIDSNYLIFQKVDNSFNFLKKIYKHLIEHTDNYNIASVEICEICNKIKICIETVDQINLIVAQLRTEGLFKKNILLFYVCPDFSIPN